MSSIVEQLTRKGLIRPPAYVVSNTIYETITGSVSYGVSTDMSDFDMVGICIPTKDVIFPHLAGEIFGFGRQKKRFRVYNPDKVIDASAQGGVGREYDINIYNIVDFFHLFTTTECVLHCSKIGNMIRDGRKTFLSKKVWHTYKGYAYGQLHEMDSKNPKPDSKRDKLRQQFGFDVKFAYNVVRLMDEVEQILTVGDIDLRRSAEFLKAIRRGEVPPADIRRIFAEKERDLEQYYHSSPLPFAPDEKAIKQLLLNCLEEHYGDLSSCVVNPDAATVALREIAEIVDKHRRVG
jgi:hypothetical protein